MAWITGIIIGVVALAVLGGVFFGGKSRDNRPVPGRFDFDGYKGRELSQLYLAEDKVRVDGKIKSRPAQSPMSKV